MIPGTVIVRERKEHAKTHAEDSDLITKVAKITQDLTEQEIDNNKTLAQDTGKGREQQREQAQVPQRRIGRTPEEEYTSNQPLVNQRGMKGGPRGKIVTTEKERREIPMAWEQQQQNRPQNKGQRKAQIMDRSAWWRSPQRARRSPPGLEIAQKQLYVQARRKYKSQ